ncbi:MAG TPA: deoxyribonuclease IV [Tepidisphaeraceae bacterium]|jgi:deoxyribonuclease-4|nr:deoxyribonuclease IV [Tepidisphaeraceae bacterium]
MFGSHLSIAGGMHKAILEAQRLGMESVQVFTKNQQQWKVKPLEAEAISLWKSHLSESGFKHTVSHDSYLINLASPDETLWRKSIDLFGEELRRCEQLGIGLLVTHPGAHVGSGEEAGLARVAAALNILFGEVDAPNVITCLEITAGQGSCLGCSLEHLATILDGVKHPEKLGVCLDTAHLFAAGYDFRGAKYKAFRKDLEKSIGVERVRVLHLNDSKRELGSRVDRHEHIGHGQIGLEGFEPFVRDKAFKNVPKILETPKAKHEDGRDWDTVNLETLRGLMK